MPRVASLYLPDFATDRIRRANPRAAPPESLSSKGEREGSAGPGQWEGEGERMACPCPRGDGWRPGARWARKDAPPPRGPSPASPLPPLVTTQRAGQRIAIAAACPAARAQGLAPGMALTQARALLPGLAVHDADPAGDAAALRRLAIFAAKRWTPCAAACGDDGLWLDLTGVTHLFGGEERMCRRLLAFCARAGFTARIALAGTWGAAHALARHGKEEEFPLSSSRRILICPPGGEAAAIAPLPLAALRIEAPALDAARRLGIERVADLLGLPRGPLVRRFGAATLMRLDQALGRTAEPIAPIEPPATPFAELRFAEPIATAEAIARAIEQLVARLADTLERRRLGARMLRLACRRVDGGDQHAAIATARPTRDAPHLVRLLAMKIETIDPGFGIEAMRLIAVRADRLGAVALALAEARHATDLAPLVDRLVGRLGPRALWRPSAVESDVPERSVARVAPLAAATGWPRDWPRPARLLSPPERIEVLALLPDSPPRRFTWRGAEHRVTRGDGPERIHGEWWRRSGEADAVRDYFRVEDEAGQRFWLYRRGDGLDGCTGDLSWFVQGLFG